jgi:hypothetical protein
MTNFNVADNDNTPLVVASTAGNDAAGNPGVFAGPLSYSVDGTGVVSIAPSSDGSQVTVTRVGTTGVATITATDGIVSSSFTVTIVPSETTSINFTAVQAAPAAAPADVPTAAPAA